ncbi:hypothetical protein PU560_05045, partial [Georgenia sp. 10Sc9-8]|nr:hypothetical protein [Georgenia halotolerans]
LFAEEEADLPRWPGPEQRDLPDRWTPWPLTPDPGGSVCLGVVFKESDDWQLDTWAARRDRGGSPPRDRWQWGLGMRPWEVFVAQVLQFQAQLGDTLRTRATAPAPDALRTRLGKLEQLLRELGEDQRTAALRQITEIGEMAQHSVEEGDTPSLADLGFLDLPPAGFLPSPAESEDGTVADVERWLGDGLVRRVCTMSLGDLGGVLAAAQSRPRTPLDGSGVPVLDIVVPVHVTHERATSWVLFVRADDVECAEPEAPATEEVEVLTRSREGDDAGEPQHLGTLRYPRGAWSVPEDVAAVFGKVQALVGADGVTAVEATTRTADRQPLGLLRATLLATAFTGQEVTPVGVRTRVEKGKETITIETGTDTDVVISLERGPRPGGDAGEEPAPEKKPGNPRKAPATKPGEAPRAPARRRGRQSATQPSKQDGASGGAPS